jgi:hypothetical protein
MKIEGIYNELHPGITMHKIPVQAGFPGVVFTIGVLAVFLMGIPGLIYFLLFATVLGIGFAVMLRFIPREAGLVAFVLTAVVFVFLVGIPAMNDWARGEYLDDRYLSAAIIAPPTPPEDEPSAFQYNCSELQSGQPSGTTQRDQGQTRPQQPSAFDGTWEGKMNHLPGVTLIVADAGGGQIGGVVTFYFLTRPDRGGKWQLRGKFLAPLLDACLQDKALIFEVQHHKKHGSPEFGPNVIFRMELTGKNEAMLYNVSEPSTGPVKLLRRA